MAKKKTYMIPSADVQNLVMEGMIASSPSSDKDVNISDKVTEDDALMSRRRRGIWERS
ncbi:MAG: hypothetical protein IIW61_06040 [Bacteroidaceae bacterium]|nr:hypothetical protein [Bacteroidaceae bacterium]